MNHNSLVAVFLAGCLLAAALPARAGRVYVENNSGQALRGEIIT